MGVNKHLSAMVGLALLMTSLVGSISAHAAMQLNCPAGWFVRQVSDYSYTCSKSFRLTLPARPLSPRPSVDRDAMFALGRQHCDNHVQDLHIRETQPDATRRFVAKVTIVCGFLT